MWQGDGNYKTTTYEFSEKFKFLKIKDSCTVGSLKLNERYLFSTRANPTLKKSVYQCATDFAEGHLAYDQAVGCSQALPGYFEEIESCLKNPADFAKCEARSVVAKPLKAIDVCLAGENQSQKIYIQGQQQQQQQQQQQLQQQQQQQLQQQQQQQQPVQQTQQQQQKEQQLQQQLQQQPMQQPQQPIPPQQQPQFQPQQVSSTASNSVHIEKTKKLSHSERVSLRKSDRAEAKEYRQMALDQDAAGKSRNCGRKRDHERK